MKLFVQLSMLGLSLTAAMQPSAQKLWVKSQNNQQYYFEKNASRKPSAYSVMELDVTQLGQVQRNTPFFDNNSLPTGISIDMPMPDGSIHSTSMVETCIWADKAMMNKVKTKTYTLINPQTKMVEGNIAILDNGIEGVLFSDKGTVSIQPMRVQGSSSAAHLVNFMKDVELPSLDCGTDDNGTQIFTQGGRALAGDCRAKAYRLAVAATGEYTSWAGGVTQAQSYIAITMNIINAIYKRDVNVTFSLIDNTPIIYTSAASDPYTTGAATSTMLNENQTATIGAIGAGGFDVGIVFTRAAGGGIAQLNSVCDNSSKARGACGDNNGSGSNPTAGPQGQWFNGAAAHELGHMFGATHTFASFNTPNCNTNRSIGSSWEPGSGSTLMAYAGAGCGSTNAIQTYQDYYFHGGSIGQMQSFIASGGTCVSGTETGNSAPTASVSGTSYTIPANTPFVLTMTSTDANNDALTYSWEQMDVTSSTTNQTVAPQPANADGPMFRSRPAVTTPTRYFPALNYLATATNYSYEVLPSIARTMNFRGTARDNSALGGCTAEVNVALSVVASAGFTVTAPGWGTVWTKNGNNTANVSWSVAGTNAAPINCTQVDILLSTDGGQTFPTTLASAVPNNGSYDVLVPYVNTTAARIMVKGRNNVFFNITTDDFIIRDILPVTFLSFTAKKSGNNALIEWSTATEANSDKFIVERSADGKDFTTQVGSIKAAGTSNQAKTYSLNDGAPLSKWNYYRLKQLDLDGKFIYSGIASVYFNRDNNSFVSVYPNPVKGNTTLSFFSQNGGKVIMEVYDSKGALVKRTTKAAVAEMNTATLNLQALPTGIYTLKCFSSTELIGVTKLVKE